MTTTDHKAGFIAIVGRPNAGKSTLVNSLVGKKVVITSKHPNTTRNPIRAIITREDFQMVLVDTPGVHKPKTMLGNRLNEMVKENLESVDAAVLCLPADEEIGAGDEYIAGQLKGIRNIYVVLTKVDRVEKTSIAEQLSDISQFTAKCGIKAKEIVPISASKGIQTELLLDLLVASLPQSPALYPPDISIDQANELTIAELIRESAIAGLYEEVPHSIVVTVEEFSKREGKNFFDIQATIHVERDSQKGIIIGKQGMRLKEIGTSSRSSIESFLGAKCFLGLHVKVSKDWQEDPKLLNKFGFTE